MKQTSEGYLYETPPMERLAVSPAGKLQTRKVIGYALPKNFHIPALQVGTDSSVKIT